MKTPRGYAGVAGDVRRADRRRRLLDAGMELLVDGGPAAVTVTGVCKQAGLTARYFYEHFTGRDGLVAAMVDAQADHIIGVARTAVLAAGGAPRDRGAAGVRALLDALDADPHAVRLTRERGEDEVVLRMRAALTARLTAALVEHAALVWPQDADHDQLPLAASLAMAGVVQLLVDWVEGASRLSRDELVRIAADFTVATGAVVLSPVPERP